MKRKETKLLSTLLALCMVLVPLPVTVQAAETFGSCGDNATWSYSDGTLTIQGTGNMDNYLSLNTENFGPEALEPRPWEDHRNQIHTIIISDGVTSIGWGAFAECDSLTSVTIPGSVTSIGWAAFTSCNSLASVSIPSGVTSIGNCAFLECRSLASVTIPDSVIDIGWGAFGQCDLTSVALPASVADIGESAFGNNSNLSSIDVVGENSAYASVAGVLFSVDKTTLYVYPAAKADTFYHIPDSVTTIEDYAFSYCRGLTGVTIPKSVTAIGDHAFDGCASLTSVAIPDNITTIGDYAFANCDSLTGVAIPDSVSTIGDHAFTDCDSLTSVTIPGSVSRIDSTAFSYCDSLTDVYYSGNESQWKQIIIVAYKNDAPDSASPTMGDYDLFAAATIHYNSVDPASTSSVSSVISVTIGGEAVEWTDAAPFIDANSRTMVPLRAVADAMGLDVNWDASIREAAFTNGSKTIYFPVDSDTARTSDGGTVQMDTAAVIVNERTYAPIRYLAEYFGYEVSWDAPAQTVSIN